MTREQVVGYGGIGMDYSGESRRGSHSTNMYGPKDPKCSGAIAVMGKGAYGRWVRLQRCVVLSEGSRNKNDFVTEDEPWDVPLTD